jgi:hypothetical protein
MKLLILFQPHSEHARVVEEFVDNLERVYPGNSIELTDVNSIEGAHKAELYDILHYPAVLAINEDGSIINSWVGDQLPLIDEVAGYLRG